MNKICYEVHGSSLTHADFLRHQTWLDPRLGYLGFEIDRVTLTGLLRVLFPFPISFPCLTHLRHLSSEADTARQEVSEVQSGLSFIPLAK